MRVRLPQRSPENKIDPKGLILFSDCFLQEANPPRVRPDDEANKNQELAHDFLSEEERKAREACLLPQYQRALAQTKLPPTNAKRIKIRSIYRKNYKRKNRKKLITEKSNHFHSHSLRLKARVVCVVSPRIYAYHLPTPLLERPPQESLRHHQMGIMDSNHS